MNGIILACVRKGGGRDSADAVSGNRGVVWQSAIERNCRPPERDDLSSNRHPAL